MKYLALAVAAAAFSASLQAAEIKYDYVEAGYLKTSFDDSFPSSFEPTGYSVAASKQIGNWFINGQYATVSEDYSVADYKVDYDFDRLIFGAGYIQALSEHTKIDYSVNLGQYKIKSNWGTGSDSDSADLLRVNAQVRHLLADQFEVNAGLGYERVQDEQSENYFVYKLGAQYYVTEQLSVNATYRNAEDYNDLSFNIRYNF